MTLTQLVPNGTQVKQGDLIAAFDPTQQMDAARDAKAKFEDLGHQVEQRVAENRANAAKRAADLRQAEADLKNDQYELQKEAVLGRIELQEDRAKAAGAAAHLASLKKSQAFHDASEVAGLRILELQRDRQKINMQRAEDNIQKLAIRAPLAGMLALEYTYRGNAYGHPQVGDQLYRGNALASIFDPSEMQVRCSINEPDILALESGSPASVTLDAYPGIALPAHFLYASPVASTGIGTPIKLFLALFHIDRRDPHLLPDLSAAVVLTVPAAAAASAGGS
ncbi:MAG: HlyD family efflux transporter periplasmic adaptor subunit [Bryobacteraceae bacterium]